MKKRRDTYLQFKLMDAPGLLLHNGHHRSVRRQRLGRRRRPDSSQGFVPSQVSLQQSIVSVHNLRQQSIIVFVKELRVHNLRRQSIIGHVKEVRARGSRVGTGRDLLPCSVHLQSETQQLRL